jgi:glycosyltransferase involved in cell wall biosynthesis
MNLIHALQSEGYRVVAISPYDEYVPLLKKSNIIHHHIPMSQYGFNPLQNFLTTFQIYKIMKKYRPLVSLHFTIKPNTFGNIAAKLANVPVINNIAGAGKAFSNNNKFFIMLIKILFKHALSYSSKVFFQNMDDMQLFLKNGLVSPDIAERIPGSGVDLKKYTPVNKNILDEITFLFIGRLLKQKGIIEFLQAANQIKEQFTNAKFVIVGEHDDNKYYIDTQTLYGLIDNKRIVYLGSKKPDDIPDIIANADCIVLPSYYREGVPRSLLEAAAMAKPIITTNNVGCKDVVDDGVNGFLCPTHDVDALIRAMIKILEMDKDERNRMGLNGRKKVENEFDEKIVIDNYIEAIDNIIH